MPRNMKTMTIRSIVLSPRKELEIKSPQSITKNASTLKMQLMIERHLISHAASAVSMNSRATD